MTRMENILFVEEEKTWKPREKTAPPKGILLSNDALHGPSS